MRRSGRTAKCQTDFLYSNFSPFGRLTRSTLFFFSFPFLFSVSFAVHLCSPNQHIVSADQHRRWESCGCQPCKPDALLAHKPTSEPLPLQSQSYHAYRTKSLIPARSYLLGLSDTNFTQFESRRCHEHLERRAFCSSCPELEPWHTFLLRRQSECQMRQLCCCSCCCGERLL